VEAAGTVEEVGSDVTEVRVGDRVCYAGMTDLCTVIGMEFFDTAHVL
jgi:NADPH:quinone reductase-like Zn-dependent oxidoreductase